MEQCLIHLIFIITFIFDIPGTLFWNIPRNSLRIYSNYTGDIPLECSTNIPQTCICPIALPKNCTQFCLILFN